MFNEKLLWLRKGVKFYIMFSLIFQSLNQCKMKLFEHIFIVV